MRYVCRKTSTTDGHEVRRIGMWFRSWARIMPPLRGSGCSLGVLGCYRHTGPMGLRNQGRSGQKAEGQRAVVQVSSIGHQAFRCHNLRTFPHYSQSALGCGTDMPALTGPQDSPSDNGFCCAENATGVVSGFGCSSSWITVMLRRRVHPEPVEGYILSLSKGTS